MATGAALTQELSTVDSFVTANPSYKGFFAVDGGSTQCIGQSIQKHDLKGKVKGGGYDLTPVTQQMLAGGYMQFTIDQQPYLQGFFPVIELYLYKVSQTLTGLADVNTGLKFLDATTRRAVQQHQESVRGHLAQRPASEGIRVQTGDSEQPPVVDGCRI